MLRRHQAPDQELVEATVKELAALGIAVGAGLSRSVGLHYRSSTSHQIHEDNRCLFF